MTKSTRTWMKKEEESVRTVIRTPATRASRNSFR